MCEKRTTESKEPKILRLWLPIIHFLFYVSWKTKGLYLLRVCYLRYREENQPRWRSGKRMGRERKRGEGREERGEKGRRDGS